VILIADADVPDPVIRALQSVQFNIRRVTDIVSSSSDRAVMRAILESGGILVTRDLGIPSQAYLYEFAKNGLTVVLLRWKSSTPKEWQEMVEIVLRESELWRYVASREPSVISVNKRGSRVRPWSAIPSEIAEQAKAKEPPLS